MDTLETTARRARHMAAAVSWLGDALAGELSTIAHSRDAFQALVMACCQASFDTPPEPAGPRQIVFVAVGHQSELKALHVRQAYSGCQSFCRSSTTCSSMALQRRQASASDCCSGKPA